MRFQIIYTYLLGVIEGNLFDVAVLYMLRDTKRLIHSSQQNGISCLLID